MGEKKTAPWWKKLILSRTIWVALMAFIATLLLDAFGIAVSETIQVTVVSFLMIVMRLVTKTPLDERADHTFLTDGEK